MFKEISFCTFLEYYSIMTHSKFHSILPKKLLRKWYRNTTFSSKMHNGENAFEVLLYLYKQCKQHTKICVFCIEMDSFWNHVIYVWIVLSFLYMEMSTTQKSLKKNIPLNFDQHPPLKHNDVEAREEVV